MQLGPVTALDRASVRRSQGQPLQTLRRFLEQSEIVRDESNHSLLLVTFLLQAMSFKREGFLPQFRKMVLVSEFVRQVLSLGISSFFSTMEIIGVGMFLETMETAVLRHVALFSVLDSQNKLDF